MEKSDALAAFAALSQPIRLDVFRTLVRAGETGMLSGEIGDTLNVRANTMSVNLGALLNARLVTKRREGRSIRYFADMDGMGQLLSFLMEDCCGGRPERCQPLIDEIACNV